MKGSIIMAQRPFDLFLISSWEILEVPGRGEQGSRRRRAHLLSGAPGPRWLGWCPRRRCSPDVLARDDEEAIEVALEHGELILRVVASDALARLEYFEAALAHELRQLGWSQGWSSGVIGGSASYE